MSNPSNLYAEKIFSEHPLALWALDDTADYVGLISEANRNIQSEWTLDGAEVVSGLAASAPKSPFPDSISSRILLDVPTGPTFSAKLVSPDLSNLANMNQDLETISVSTFLYSNSVYVESVSIGYEYTDPTTSLVVVEKKDFTNISYNLWQPLSATLPIVNKDATIRIFISINTVEGGIASTDYEFYINGITCGQWSEEFNLTSLGSTVQAFPEDIAVPGTFCVIADAYGLQASNGYYLANETSLFAKNTSIPLVYGASGVTKLIENFELPSLILPGQGFLNESGRYNEYTVEFWARIDSDASEPRRIFGPIASADGLYVEPGFLTLKIGNSIASHFIGEWYRPMLIDIRVVRDGANLLVNGEQVLSIAFDTDTLELPSILSQPALKEQDWIGFYCYSDVPSFEIDCVAIYSYQVPISVAKRRWVYGQAVESPEGINSAYGGSSAFIDYTFANYAVNYSYPGLAQWQQGSFDNLSATASVLRTPEYNLPEIYLESKTPEQFYLSNEAAQSETNTYITFRPDSSWNNKDCYINFTNFNILSDQIHSIYGVFKVKEDDTSIQTLFKFYNILTGDYFAIRKDGANIDYYISINGEETEFYSEQDFPINEIFAVGINIEKLAQTFGGEISAFFGNTNGLRMYVAGDDEGNTFTGNIYSIGFSTNFNSSEIIDHFDSNGFAIFGSGLQLLDHTASYTLLPTRSYDSFYLDIGVSGYWQDYMPLSYFAKSVKNDVGNEYYDLDFLQLNIDYPSPTKTIEAEVAVDSFLYEDLLYDFANPEQKTYADLDNALFTEWADYEDMAQKSVKQFSYDTSKAIVKSYITFQYIDEGANYPNSHFTTTHIPTNEKILDMSENQDWYTTKFEVLDNTLIYPSKTIDFNEVAIVYHLDFKTRGILTKPIKLKGLSIASQAFDNNSTSPIGTRFGNNIYPYTKSAIGYDYKAKNPFSIYKGSTPYLYMTKNSGIEIRGDFDQYTGRGLSFPVNQAVADNYTVSAMQLWYRNDARTFSLNPVQIFQIEYQSDIINFYSVAINDSGTRARIYAIRQSSNSVIEDITYYVNGRQVLEPVITIGEWSVIGMSFANSLDFSLFLGSININGQGLFNNISYYQANNLQQVQSRITRPWVRVYENDTLEFTWESWRTATNGDEISWDNTLTVSVTEAYAINPSAVYSTYIGTNKIIIDDNEGMVFDADKLRVFESVEWSSATVVPV